MRDVFCCDCMHPEGFVVTVDHARSRDEMIVAGGYRHVPSEQLDGMAYPFSGTCRFDVRLGLLHLYRTTDLQSVLDAVQRRRIKLADDAELLALGVQHPELQRMSTIVALGTVHVDPELPDWPSALALTGFRDERDEYRDLDVFFLEHGLKAGTHILVVK